MPLLKSWEQKRGSGTKAGYSICHLHSIAPKDGQITQGTLLAQPLDKALTLPHIWNHLALPTQGVSKGSLFLFPLAAIEASVKSLPEFLVWPLIFS